MLIILHHFLFSPINFADQISVISHNFRNAQRFSLSRRFNSGSGRLSDFPAISGSLPVVNPVLNSNANDRTVIVSGSIDYRAPCSHRRCGCS